jgi:predicted AAA+ superfamily ATPase
VQTAIDQVNALIGDKVKEFEQDSPANMDDAPDNPLAFAPVEAEGAMQEFRDATCVDTFTKDEVDAMILTLNADQKRMFDNDTRIISDTSPNRVVLRKYVSGTAGTGKSHYIKILKAWVNVYLGKDVAVSAPTGIAAFNVNGLTLHRLLQLPVEHGHTSKYTELSDQVLKVLRDKLKNVVLFIIDEIPQ